MGYERSEPHHSWCKFRRQPMGFAPLNLLHHDTTPRWYNDVPVEHTPCSRTRSSSPDLPSRPCRDRFPSLRTEAVQQDIRLQIEELLDTRSDRAHRARMHGPQMAQEQGVERDELRIDLREYSRLDPLLHDPLEHVG